MIYRFNRYVLDSSSRELRHEGKLVAVEPQVFDLLLLLIENRDRVVGKEEIIDLIWQGRVVSDVNLSSRIHTARRAVGDNGREQAIIRTVFRRGFRFVADTVLVEPSDRRKAEQQESTNRKAQTIRFCISKDRVRIAYATTGNGPPLVKAPNWMTHLEYEWESPFWRHFLDELSRDHTLVRFDQRGNGLSDWDVEDLSFEACVSDLETVVDVLEVKRFPLIGISQGCPISIAYAVRHPERVSHLILYGGFARGGLRRGQAEKERTQAMITLIRRGWAQDNPAFRQLFTSRLIPDGTPEEMKWLNELQRISVSPENAALLRETTANIDVMDLLRRVTTPTLVLHCRGDANVPFGEGRRLAATIPGARFVPMEGNNHLILEHTPAWREFLKEFRDFLGVHNS